MDLIINVEVQGKEISFLYEHFRYGEHTWAARISDECMTVEESLTAATPDKCLDELIPFLDKMGKVTSITSSEPSSPYIDKLQHKLANHAA
jgi:hypothetical protein